MSRRIVAAMGIALLTVMTGASWASASGGGGCPPPITNGTVTKAVVESWCYEPTAIYIRPGDTITWVNKDPVPHTITGANRAWGSYDKLRPGKRLSYSFDRTGAYPYYCVYHLGMVGTVVVWDGEMPDLSRPGVSRDSVHRVRPAEELASATIPAHSDRPDGTRASVGLVVAGAPAAVVLWIIAARRHRIRAGG
jgi:plastocyanin